MVRHSAIAFERTGIMEVVTAPRSPWQNPYAERLIGSIRRECLDHVCAAFYRAIFNTIVTPERHLSLGKDCSRPRPIQSQSAGNIIAFLEVGGLHHRYERRAA
jgi:putative transposase